jgi:hypothetical protein
MTESAHAHPAGSTDDGAGSSAVSASELTVMAKDIGIKANLADVAPRNPTIEYPSTRDHRPALAIIGD